MRSFRGRQFWAVFILVVLAFGVFWTGRVLYARGLTWAANFSSVASMFLAALALLMPLFAQVTKWLHPPRPASHEQLTAAREELAAALGREWAEEERLRRIYDPRPLPVRWEVTPTASAATALAANSTIIGLAGQFKEIHALLTRLSPARLVILGTAGAGKSVLAVKLARDMLEKRTSGMPVPVVLQATTWDAEKKELPDWLADQLATRQASLAEPVKGADHRVMSLGRALVADGLIFPIIDGFDELPEGLRAKAVEKINHFGSDHGLVVTSRPEEYGEAASALGRGMARAAVVEVLPLRVIEVKQYLSEATAVGAAHRWEAVFGLLDAEPNGPLARVLCTPLMLWLARTVYEPGAATPAELADSRHFADANSLEKHLLDAFIPAVYGNATAAHRPRYRFQSAGRWLGFLAQQHQPKSGFGFSRGGCYALRRRYGADWLPDCGLS